MALKVAQSPMNGWQSAYLRHHIRSFKRILENIETSAKQHYERKQFKLDEDPWDNYMYHDATHLVPVICHSKSQPISHQVIISKFLEQAVADETISQFNSPGNQIIDDLISFASNFDQQQIEESDIIDESDEEQVSLVQRIDSALKGEGAQDLERDMQRMLKMFYLESRIRGKLHEYKDDYFV